MSSVPSAIVIGIGSDHGDDRVGWIVSDAVEKLCDGAIKCLKVKTPIDLIEWLDAADQVHLVDATAGVESEVRRLRYGCEEQRKLIAKLPPNGTHGFGVHRALELAESLDRRTDHVHLWLVSGSSFRPFTSLSQSACSAIDKCVQLLVDELRIH